MRELWHTGWMHNRVRMIVASFLTKNLRQHWLHGARWFHDTLVDADLANNTLGWQWVAGCGADAAPYFRVFNPLTQAKKFDPDRAYLRRWLPELAEAPVALLHEPWKDAALLRRSGYPAPMVDLGQSRQQALDAYAALAR
jgi:deoxyribodipyrimidine photo-lyase